MPRPPAALAPIAVLVVALEGLSGPGAAAAEAPASRTVIAEDGAQRPAWFICDATDAPMVAVVGLRGPGGLTPIRLFLKRGAQATTEVYTVGGGDPGAGQVYFPLTRDGRPAGSLHMVNPGMLENPLTPTFTSIDLAGRARASCRWRPGVRFLGFDARRSVQVRATPAGLVYESFDFARPGVPVETKDGGRSSTPSVSVAGGREEAGPAGATAFVFTRASYTYRIDAPGHRPATPATLTVSKGGRRVQSGALTAYTVAPSPDGTPEGGVSTRRAH